MGLIWITIGWLLLICMTFVGSAAILLGLLHLLIRILAGFGKIYFLVFQKDNKLYELYKELHVKTWGNYRYRSNDMG